jgi:hypothetical protein
MRIRIIKSDPDTWYSNLVGSFLESLNKEDESGLYVINPDPDYSYSKSYFIYHGDYQIGSEGQIIQQLEDKIIVLENKLIELERKLNNG